ncbi:MAG: ABC transporter ATP-binding protein [Lachnospiraceae bacterium]|nr:ABC transporter ATP-binding protein [Lachnospiraceae bacterium]
MQILIELKNVSKEYKMDSGETGTMALNGVSLMIHRGEFIAIMGTSGSGKSTLLNIIGAMDDVTTGEYYFKRETVHNKNNREIHLFRKKHISFVFQNFALMDHYTVFENVELPLRAKNVSKKQRKKIILEQLKKLGIEELAEKMPRQLSGGQQQRCAIARALASGNDVILADEPTGALDSRNSKEIMEIFKELNKEGKTIIVVTHDENIAKETQRIIKIEDGKILIDK